MANLGANFYPKLVQIASEVGMKPEDIIAIMASESGINPNIPNQAGAHVIGLIQFSEGTLKGLGYDKNWKEFGNVSAIEQLDYVKKYIQAQANFNGRPLESAAKFYIATYLPVGLRLPGIQRNDPDAIFVEEHPETIRVGNRVWSKKYYDIGVKLDPNFESKAYKENSLFHGSMPGVIRLRDMQAQVDRTKSRSTYQNAIKAMHNATGVQVSDTHAPSAAVPTQLQPQQSYWASFMNKLMALMSKFISASESNNYSILKNSSYPYTSKELMRVASRFDLHLRDKK